MHASFQMTISEGTKKNAISALRFQITEAVIPQDKSGTGCQTRYVDQMTGLGEGGGGIRTRHATLVYITVASTEMLMG